MTDDDVEKLAANYEIALNHEHGLTLWHLSDAKLTAVHGFEDHLKKYRDTLRLED